MLINSLSNSVFGLALVWLVCVIGVDWAVAQGSGEATRKRPPNIVLIMADDLGYNELGCYGQKWIKTPNIDSIAAHGMRFTQHYSGQAVCAPSRCSLLTGLHQGHAFIRGNGNPKARRGKGKAKDLYFPGQHPIPDETVTLFELLKRRGYATGAMGKWGLGFEGSSGDPANQGVDLFYGYLCQVHAHNHYPRFLWRNDKKEILPGNERKLTGQTYSQDKFTEVALEFIDQNKDQPFFLYLPFAIPHLSIQVPEDSLNEYKDKIPESEYKHRGYLQHPQPHAGYAAMISHMDRDIGKIMARLDQHGLTENTLVIFTSDNGPTYNRLGGSDSVFFESAGELRGRKGSLYEGGIRVPMVAQWPGKIQPGSVSKHVSAFWDYLPTLCEVAGVENVPETDGLSFLPELIGKPQSEHQHLYWEFSSYGGQQAIRMGKWKGVRKNLIKNPKGEIELYDLTADIGEAKNVAAENPEVVTELKKLLNESHTRSELFPFPSLDEKVDF